MVGARSPRRRAGHFLLVLLVSTLAGCASPDTAPAPTPTAAVPPPTAAPVTLTAVPPTVTSLPAGTADRPAPSPTPDAPLNPRGPWLLFAASAHPDYPGWPAGLFAVNPDGTGLTQLTEERALPGIIPSPQGNRAAYLVGGERPGSQQRTLRMIAAPGWLPRDVASLTPPGLDDASLDAADPLWLALQAVEASPPVWSPRGTHLAFVSAAEGPTADLYVYPLFAGRALRLSTEEGQAINPRWSPGGRWIAYGVAYSLGEGVRGADEQWVAAADGSLVRPLLEAAPAEGARTVALGWGGPDALLVAQVGVTRSTACPYTDLWSVDVARRGRVMLHAGDFAGAAVDPASGVALVAASAAEGCAGEGGLVLYRPNLPDARIAGADELGGRVQFVRWSAAVDQFEVWVGEGSQPPGAVLWVDLNGRIRQTDVPPGLQVTLSPDGVWTALHSMQGGAERAGLWVGRGGDLPQPVFDGGVEHVLWLPDSSGLFFLHTGGERRLWLARAPGFTPVPVTGEMMVGAPVWLAGR